MGLNLTFWSPTIGDQVLTSALLGQVAGTQIAQTSITTVGAGVLTAAALVGGQIARTGPVGAYTDTTATAAAIVTALGGFVAGQTFNVNLKNGTQYPQTLAAGTGVTLPAAGVIPPFALGAYFGTVGGTAASPTVVFTHADTTPIRTAGVISNPQAAALVTVGAGALTVASMNAGVTARGGTQIAAFADTTDTAAAIISGVQALSAIGASQFWTYVNNTVFPGTITAGSGVTITGAAVVPANSWIKYLITYTAAGAVTLLAVEQGYFPKLGVTGAANGATPVTVSDAAVTANSKILLTINTLGGTAHGAFVSAKSAGVGFTMNSIAGDTSTYDYEIRG